MTQFVDFREFLQNVGPIQNDKQNISKTALDAAQEIMMSEQNENSVTLSRQSQTLTPATSAKEGESKETPTQNEQSFSRSLTIGAIKKMLELLCDESVIPIILFIFFHLVESCKHSCKIGHRYIIIAK